MSDEFLEANRRMIHEEMEMAINSLNELVPSLTDEESGPIAITETNRLVGYLTALYNQLLVIENREIPEQRPVGFHITQ